MGREDFFNDQTVQELLQGQIEKVDRLTETQQRNLLKTFRAARRELNDRLLVVPSGTFTEQSLRITLAQVDAITSAIRQDLTTGMVDASDILAQRGLADLTREINRFNKKFTGAATPINLDSILATQDTNNFLINKHEASIAAYTTQLGS